MEREEPRMREMVPKTNKRKTNKNQLRKDRARKIENNEKHGCVKVKYESR